MTMSRLYNVAQFIILVMVTIVIFTVGPRVETLLFPVITRFEIPSGAIFKHPDGSTEISGILVKARGECEPVQGSLTVFTEEFNNDTTHPAKEIRVEFEPGDKWNSRPAGSQYFGPWRLVPPGPPLGPALMIRIKHKCHPFWETETVLYQGLTEDFFTNTQIHGEEPWEKGNAE